VWARATRPRSAYRMPTHPDHSQFLYLTTRGRKTGQPREIEIWFTHLDGHYYVIAEYPTSHWVQNLRAHPDVQVRVEGKSFAARARVLTPKADSVRLDAVQELSRNKYGWGDGQVVELTPRQKTENREQRTEN
jgi:deazaflavin-dependent oxidoreductase (nitroreductase family)